MRLRSHDFAARLSPGRATRIAAYGPAASGRTATGGTTSPLRASDSAFAPIVMRALESGHVLGGDVFALHECDIPLCVKVNPAECLRQHVIAGPSRRTCGGWLGRGAAAGAPRFEGWAAKRGARARWRCVMPCGTALRMLMPSTARCWAVNRDCSERPACERN